MSRLAWTALSAFCLVMDVISSSAEDVSSRDAACSDDPSASCWLADETSPEAAATWSEASSRPLMARLIGTIIALPRRVANTSPTARPTRMKPMMATFPVAAVLEKAAMASPLTPPVIF